MAIRTTDDTNYSNIAAAIREKLRVTNTWKPGQMAEQIRNITVGEPDWRELGYPEAPDSVIAGFNYAKDIQENWDTSVTNLSSAFKDNNEIMFFPNVSMENATNTSNMFNGSSIESYDVPNLLSVTNAGGMFRNCKNLREININLGEFQNNYYYKKVECPSDTQVTTVLFSEIEGYTYSSSDYFTVTRNGELLKTSNPNMYSITSTAIVLTSTYYLDPGDELEITIYKSLTSLGHLCTDTISLSSATVDCGNRVGSLESAFSCFGSYTLSMPTLLNTDSVTTVTNMFNALTNFRPGETTLSFPNANSANGMFQGVGNYNNSRSEYKTVTYGPITLDLPVCENCSNLFYSDDLLIGASVYCPNAKNLETAFFGCGDVTSISIDLSSATITRGLFNGCSSLTNSNLNITYNINPVGGAVLENCESMFEGCSNLTHLPDVRSLNTPWGMTSFAKSCSKITYTPTATITAWKLTDFFKGCTRLETINYEFDPDPATHNDHRCWLNGMFYGCSSLQTAPDIGKIGSDEANAFSINELLMQDMYNGCSSLQNVPEIQLGSSVNCNPNTSNMYASCIMLSDTSLNNILQTCINIKNATGNTRTLASMGFSTTYYPASRIEALSNYQAFYDSGCRIGY